MPNLRMCMCVHMHMCVYVYVYAYDMWRKAAASVCEGHHPPVGGQGVRGGVRVRELAHLFFMHMHTSGSVRL